MDTFDVEFAREEVQYAVDDSSLRSVAREVGLSATGLKQFSEGTAPYGPTIRKLRRWLAQRPPRRAPSAQDVAAAVDLLLRELPEDVQLAVRAEIAEILDRVYDGMAGAASATSLVRIFRLPGSFPAPPPPVRRTAMRSRPRERDAPARQAASTRPAPARAAGDAAPSSPLLVVYFDAALGRPRDVPAGAVLVAHPGPVGWA